MTDFTAKATFFVLLILIIVSILAICFLFTYRKVKTNKHSTAFSNISNIDHEVGQIEIHLVALKKNVAAIKKELGKKENKEAPN